MLQLTTPSSSVYSETYFGHGLFVAEKLLAEKLPLDADHLLGTFLRAEAGHFSSFKSPAVLQSSIDLIRKLMNYTSQKPADMRFDEEVSKLRFELAQLHPTDVQETIELPVRLAPDPGPEDFLTDFPETYGVQEQQKPSTGKTSHRPSIVQDYPSPNQKHAPFSPNTLRPPYGSIKPPSTTSRDRTLLLYKPCDCCHAGPIFLTEADLTPDLTPDITSYLNAARDGGASPSDTDGRELRYIYLGKKTATLEIVHWKPIIVMVRRDPGPQSTSVRQYRYETSPSHTYTPHGPECSQAYTQSREYPGLDNRYICKEGWPTLHS